MNKPGEWSLVFDHDAPLEDAMRRVGLALRAVELMGGLEDGAMHKQYALDQVARALTGRQYAEWVRFVQEGDYGPWEEGTAP